MISLWGLDMRPGSLYPYAVSFSVFAQVFLLPIVGGIADRIKSRNGLLAVFAYIGSISTMFLYFVKDGRYALGAFLLIVANISFGAALVVAGLAASGITEIGDVFHIDRGYDDIVGRLSSLGASISRVRPES